MELRKLISDVEAYCADTGYSEVTVCLRATGNGRLLDRLRKRADKTDEDIQRLTDYINSHRPAG